MCTNVSERSVEWCMCVHVLGSWVCVRVCACVCACVRSNESVGSNERLCGAGSTAEPCWVHCIDLLHHWEDWS